MLLDDLLSRRLVVLTGKGGVGKSAVGAALALAAQKRGKRALLVEVDAPKDTPRYLGAAPAGATEVEILPGISAVNLKPFAVMDEYVRHTVKLEWISKRILESPVYHRFFATAPGLKELMLLGKIVVLAEEKGGWSRRPRHDVVIVDAPATGHGLSLMRVPIAASLAIPVGPIGHQARWILRYLRDPEKTALAVVAIPEEMAVVEAVEFSRSAQEDVGIETRALFLNACHERRFSAAEESEILSLTSQGADGRLPGGRRLSQALLAARRQMRRRKLTQFYETRLRRALKVPMLKFPFVYGELGIEETRRMADRLLET